MASANSIKGCYEVVMSANHKVQNCSCCNTNARCRQRNFSEEALALLLLWGEIEVKHIDAPVCEYCYEDLRDVLIDRAAEVEVMHKKGLPKEVEQMIVNTIQPLRGENKAV